MKGVVNTGIGEVTIDHDVLANYAGSAAVECFGVVGMASVSMKEGFARLLKRESLSNGVDLKVEGDRIKVSLHVIVAYGVSISAVADNLISNVKYKFEEYTGMKVEAVRVFVEGVRELD